MQNPTSTKRGPGRKHCAGHQKDSPIVPKGAPRGFVQRENPERSGPRRAYIKAYGIRQWKRSEAARRNFRAWQREMAAKFGQGTESAQ